MKIEKKIIIIGDFYDELIKSRQDFFDSGVDIFCPPGIVEFNAIWEFSHNFDLIIINGYYQNGSEGEIISLVKKIRLTFNGPIIAVFLDFDFNDWLIQLGCDYEVKKEDVSKKVKEILFL
jgi:hypothetical protein